MLRKDAGFALLELVKGGIYLARSFTGEEAELSEVGEGAAAAPSTWACRRLRMGSWRLGGQPGNRAQIHEHRAREYRHVQRELQPHSRSRWRADPEASAVERETSKQRGRQRREKHYRNDSDRERSDPPGQGREQQDAACELEWRQTQREQVDEHGRHDRERRGAIRELQRVADLVDARVNEYGSHGYADREHRIVATRIVGRHHRTLPVEAGIPAADHASHPPVKTLTLLKPRLSNALATSRLSWHSPPAQYTMNGLSVAAFSERDRCR